MRIVILVLAASALTLSSCGKKEGTGNTTALDEGATAQDFATNDVTAIDAATGADANMAADVDINYSAPTGTVGASSTGSAPARSRPRNAETANESSNSTAPAQQSEAQPAAPPAQPAQPATANSN